MEFCPTCGLLLQLEPARFGQKSRLFCPNCPYVCTINRKIVKKLQLSKKEVEPIFTEQDRLKMSNKSDSVNCPKCRGTGAYFHEMQTRSADEPSTIFYMCCNESCKAQWRED